METTVIRPDGTEAVVTHPKGATSDQIIAIARAMHEREKPVETVAAVTAQPDSAPAEWNELPGNLAPTLGKAAVGMYDGLVQMVSSPVDSTVGLLELIIGTASRSFPDVAEEEGGLQKMEALSRDAQDAILARYGGWAELKQTVITDPGGVAVDIASFFLPAIGASAKVTGLAGLANKIRNSAPVTSAETKLRNAPIVKDLEKVIASKNAQSMQTALRVAADPTKILDSIPSALGKTARGAGNAAMQVLSKTTGVGVDNFKDLFTAGKVGKNDAVVAARNMRNPDDNLDDMIDYATDGAENLRRARSAEYTSGMGRLGNDPTELSLDGINEAMAKATADNSFLDQPKSKAKQAALKEVQKEIDDWAELGSEYRTPLALDALKQRISSLTNWKDKTSDTNNIYAGTAGAVRETIAEQAPEYRNIMRDYASASDDLNDIKNSLGALKNKDVTHRRLRSSGQNDVNAAFGQRRESVNLLDSATEAPLKPAIAGQSAASWTPRGMAGALSPITALGAGTMSPWALLAAPIMSPRVMGEAALATGRVADKVNKSGPALKARMGPRVVEALGPQKRPVGPGEVPSMKEALSPSIEVGQLTGRGLSNTAKVGIVVDRLEEQKRESEEKRKKQQALQMLRALIGDE
tara:strand:+ start:872 stop:2785 length:1914 start_codon:yes stop_codon:yes gene_type:complete